MKGCLLLPPIDCPEHITLYIPAIPRVAFVFLYRPHPHRDSPLTKLIAYGRALLHHSQP